MQDERQDEAVLTALVQHNARPSEFSGLFRLGRIGSSMISGRRRAVLGESRRDNGLGLLMGRRNIALILLCLGFSGAARPQDQSMTLLRQAAHCLATTGPDAKRLLKGKPKVLSLGYYLDSSSYPGEEALYLVNYEGSNFSKGLAFIFFVGEKDHRRIFRLENNASFVRKKKGIEFIETPLGGIWTQEHLEAAIEHIEQEPKMELLVKDLREKFPDVRCESYSDAR
jgi:hypothetical protein